MSSKQTFKSFFYKENYDTKSKKKKKFVTRAKQAWWG